MNAGFITKKREEQLWEVQRIITQLKRKLRSFEKKQEKSVEELDSTSSAQPAASTVGEDTTDSKPAAETGPATKNSIASEEPKTEELATIPSAPDYTIDSRTGFVVLPNDNPHREELLRLQIEYEELKAWKHELKARILAERNEVFKLKQLCDQQNPGSHGSQPELMPSEADYVRVIEHYTRENALLEHKKQMLGIELKEERRACIALQVELRMHEF